MKSDTQNIKSLKKEINLPEAITMVVGVVIGSGIFFKASSVFNNAGTPILGILAWAVGGMITIASALTIAEIAAAIPETGGIFVYLKKLYGEQWAFLFGWMQTIIYTPGVIAALSIVFATQATYFTYLSPMSQKILAIFIIFFITIINVISTKLGSKLQFIATVAKLIPIFVIIVFGLLYNKSNGFATATATSSSSISVGLSGFGAAILGTLWAYDGWANVGNMAGELKNPRKDLPRSIITGLVIIIVVYILINIAIIKVMPITKVIASQKAASDAAVILLGSKGAALIAVGIMISILGALNGYLMTGVRVPFAMAQDKLFPFANFFGKLSDKFGTPINTLLFQAVLAALYVLSGSFETLTNLAVFSMWIFFVMTVIGIFILRSKHKDIKRPYTVPLFPIVPIVGIGGGVYILISTLISDTSNALYGLAVTALGIPIYIFIKKRNSKL
ncbi:APC family permease [Clostridium neuense]|uniref:APC family permease n=1 Tax=Clostridium neuense TaxID=1728934 RepID=A0ABW8TEI1_9CLOT